METLADIGSDSRSPNPKTMSFSDLTSNLKQNVSTKKTGSTREVKFNPRELEVSLQKEIQADERHQLINDAKLRALNQGTSTYEDFRQIWMAAHLKPMEKEDKLDAFLAGPGSKVLWNSIAASKDDGEAGAGLRSASDDLEGSKSLVDVATKTPQDLIRTMKKLQNPEAKFDYLKRLLEMEDGQSHSNLATLWKEEVPSELLSDVFEVFGSVLGRWDFNGEEVAGSQMSVSEDILRILEIVSNSRRFGITLSFMSKSDKKNVEDFFTRLDKFMSDQEGKDNPLQKLINVIQGRFLFPIAGRLNFY